jgi:hypothetical protein
MKPAFAPVCSWATLRVKEITPRQLQKEYKALGHKEEELWTKSPLSRRTSTSLCRAANLLTWLKVSKTDSSGVIPLTIRLTF